MSTQWLTAKEAAGYLRISYTSLRRLVKRREITFSDRLRGKLLFKRQWLDEFLESSYASKPPCEGKGNMGSDKMKRKLRTDEDRKKEELIRQAEELWLSGTADSEPNRTRNRRGRLH